MKKGSIYNKQTGQITMTVIAPDEEGVLLQISDEGKQAVLWDHELNGRELYVVNGEPAERPLMPLTYTTDGVAPQEGEPISLAINGILRVENIPAGTQVAHPDGELTVDDGFIEWSAVEPGHYFFRFDNFPFQEVNFHAIVG